MSKTSYADGVSYSLNLLYEPCYEACFFNFTCLAIQWSSDTCRFITSKKTPIPCPEDSSCVDILGAKFKL